MPSAARRRRRSSWNADFRPRGAVTSIRPLLERNSCHETAAERWLSSACGPQASTAARSWAREVMAMCPAAYTLRRTDQPAEPEPHLDCPPGQAQLQQPGQCDGPVLRPGHGADRQIPGVLALVSTWSVEPGAHTPGVAVSGLRRATEVTTPPHTSNVAPSVATCTGPPKASSAWLRATSASSSSEMWTRTRRRAPHTRA
jgi:hypothetical protein